MFKLKSQFFRRNLVHSIAKMKPNCPVDLFSLEFYHTHLCTLSSLSICPVGLSYQSFPGFCNPQPILVEYILSVLAITSYFKGNIFRCLYCQNLSFSACCTETKFCWWHQIGKWINQIFTGNLMFMRKEIMTKKQGKSI